MTIKPESFYRVGETLTVSEHEPPSLDELSSMPKIYWDELDDIREMPMIERCLKFSPHPDGAIGDSFDLELLAPIRTGQHHMSQIWKVKANKISRKAIVAKFYDPVFTHSEVPEYDEINNTQRNYIRETAAYSHLSRLQGHLIPDYYGSFSCDFVYPEGTHSVRLILIEFIPGVCLDKLYPDVGEAWEGIPKPVRENLIKKMISIDTLAAALGVNHKDIAPRNFIAKCCPDSPLAAFKSPTLRMVLIDFELAMPTPVAEKWRVCNGLPVSPILRWSWNEMLTIGLNDWLVDFDWPAWLEETFATSPIFAPVTKKYEKHYKSRHNLSIVRRAEQSKRKRAPR